MGVVPAEGDRRLASGSPRNVPSERAKPVRGRWPRTQEPWRQRNQDAISTARSFDGIYALATNLPGRITAGKVLRLYKDQQIVERRHRDMKQTLKVRPIFLHNDDRVYALISIVGIALLIFGLIEAQTRAALGETQQLTRAAEDTGQWSPGRAISGVPRVLGDPLGH